MYKEGFDSSVGDRYQVLGEVLHGGGRLLPTTPTFQLYLLMKGQVWGSFPRVVLTGPVSSNLVSGSGIT